MEILALEWHDVIGIVGVIFYIGSYFLLQIGWLDGNRMPYAVLNLLAPVAVLISLTETFNLASALIQVSWILISIVGICVKFYKHCKPGRSISADSQVA